MKLILTIGLCLILTNILGQDARSADKKDNNRVFGDTLIIFYGETLYFEATMDGNKITGFKQTDQTGDPDKTIKITLGNSSFGGNGSTEMKITNPFNKTLNYKAEMKTSKTRMRFVETSVVPVYPKIFSMEMWQERIEIIMLTNFELN